MLWGPGQSSHKMFYWLCCLLTVRRGALSVEGGGTEGTEETHTERTKLILSVVYLDR
jgi:hypothetical protein